MAIKKPEKKVNKASAAKKTPTKATSKKIEKKVQKQPEVKKVQKEKPQKPQLLTHSGHKLSLREAKFIDSYVEHGNQRQAVLDSGYNQNSPGQYAQKLLTKDYIKEEIEFRMQEHRKYSVATREEIMDFFARMMRGEILDQFDMPTTNGDKIKAGIELAKRTIDIEDRLKERATQTAAPEIKISLDWGGGRNGEED